MNECYVVIGLILDDPVRIYLNNLYYLNYSVVGYRAIDIKTGNTVDITKDEYIQLRDIGKLIELDDDLLEYTCNVKLNDEFRFSINKRSYIYLSIIEDTVYKCNRINDIIIIRQDNIELGLTLLLAYDLLEDRLKIKIIGDNMLPYISIDYLSGEYSVSEDGYDWGADGKLKLYKESELGFHLTSLFDSYSLFDNGYAYINKICLLGCNFNGDAIVSNECDTLVINAFSNYNSKDLGNIVVPPSISKVYNYNCHSVKKSDNLNLFLSKDLSSEVINNICKAMFADFKNKDDFLDNEYYLKNFNVKLY